MKDALQTLILTLFFAITAINHTEASHKTACTGDVRVYLDLMDGYGLSSKEERESVIGIPVVEFVNLKTKKSYLLEYVSDNNNDYNNFHFLDSLPCGKYRLYLHYIYSPKVEYNVEVIGFLRNDFRFFQKNNNSDTAFTIIGRCHYFFNPDYNHIGVWFQYGDDRIKAQAILDRYNAKYIRTVGSIRIYELKNVVRNYFNSPLLKEIRECGIHAGPIYKSSERKNDIQLFSNGIDIYIKKKDKAAFDKYISDHGFNVTGDETGGEYTNYHIELPKSYGFGVNSIMNELIHKPWGLDCSPNIIRNGPEQD